jgi:hypothetical protein
MVFMIESQIAYVLDALAQMRGRGWAAVDVRPEVAAAYNEKLGLRHAGTVWQSGCRSWYLDARGRNTALWPGFTFTFRRQTARFDAGAYAIEKSAVSTAADARVAVVDTGGPQAVESTG